MCVFSSLFANTKSVVKSVKVPVGEVAECTNRFHRIPPYILRWQVRRLCVASEQMSCLVVKLHSLYRCRLVRRISYAGNAAVEGSVLIVAVREYIVAPGAVCSSSASGGGRSFSTLLLPRSWMAVSTACVCRFWRLSFLLAPSLWRTVESCLEWRVSCLGSWVVMSWQTWSSSRQFTMYCTESMSEWSLNFSVMDSWWKWSILSILWATVAVLRAAFCAVCIFLNLESFVLVLQR